MPDLYLICKEPGCGIEFRSQIQVDEKSFKTTELINNSQNCPKGHVHIYDKPDYYFK